MKKYRNIIMLRNILITIILFIIMFSVFIYIDQKRNQEHQFFEIGNDITMQTIKALEYWIEDQVRVVKTIASDKRVIDACNNPEDEKIVKEAEEYLKEMHERYPYYENLPLSIKLDDNIERDVDGKKVIIKNGTFLTDTVGGKTIGRGGIEYSYVNEIFKGKQYFVSEIYPSILRGNPIFVISAPIKCNNKIIGAAIISPQIEHFTEKFINNVILGKTGYMFFIDGRGLVIAHKNKEYILDSSEKMKKINHINTRVVNGESNFQDNYLGKKKHYVSIKVNIDKDNLKYEWYVVATQNDEEIFHYTNDLLKLIVIIIVISIIFITIVLYIIIDSNQKEIHKEDLILMNKSLEKKVKERTKELEDKAIRDSLTNLLNHKASYELLEKEINNSEDTLKPISIIMLDLDHFKRVNDTYGHQAGDEVLVSVSSVIISNIRETDAAGRYGGEEFIMILPNTDKDDALMIANKIKDSISEMKFQHEGLNVTASMGVSKWNGETVVDLISKTDNLLYKAKLNGRNRIETH